MAAATMTNTPAPEAKTLPEGYYLDNFRCLMDVVERHHGNLLNDAELSFSRNFRACSQAAQRLLVRLVSRKGPLFRSDKLQYPEIEDIPVATEALVRWGLLTVNGKHPTEEVLALLTKRELCLLLTAVSSPPPQEDLGKWKKPALRDRAAALSAETLAAWCHGRFQILARPCMQQILIYRLLFFGNLDQDLSEFVITDLGNIHYEPYPMDTATSMFKNRQVLDSLFHMLLLRESLYQAVEEKDTPTIRRVMAQLHHPGKDPILESRFDKLANVCGRYFEQAHLFREALACFALAKAPPARERRARIHVRLGENPKALALCEEILTAPRDELERGFALRFLPRQRKKLGLSHRPFSRMAHPTTILELPKDEGRVEVGVLKHLAKQGSEGFHSENQLWLALFGLAFWDIIFADVAGAFFNPFQRGPLDMFTPDFRAQRETAIQARLEEMREGRFTAEVLLDRFREKQGTANFFVNWQVLPVDLITLVLTKVPMIHLAAVCDRLTRNPRELRNGFPDLFLFTQEPPGYELAEVKGPGDQLQLNQRHWLRYFAEQGIPYRVIRVRWLNSE